MKQKLPYALDSYKKKKAPEMDDINAELIKQGSFLFHMCLLHFKCFYTYIMI